MSVCVTVCVCVCVCVCVSLSADASGPTECEMEQGGSGFSRHAHTHKHTQAHTHTHTHTHTHLSLCFYLLLSASSSSSLYIHFPLFPRFHFHPLPPLFSFLCSLHPFPLSFHLSNLVYISPSPLYSASLSLWIKLSLLRSLFFSPCSAFIFRLDAVYVQWHGERDIDGERERGERQHPHVRPMMD